MSEKEQNVDKPNTNDVQLNESVPCYVCNKCGNTISSNLGGFTVHYMDSTNQENGTKEARRKEEDGYSSDDYDLEDYDPNYDHGFNCPCGSYDCRQFMTTTTGRNYREYDHSEEAS